MIYLVDSHHSRILTREALTPSQWAEKFDRFNGVSSFTEDKLLISFLKLQYALTDGQIAEIDDLLKKETIKYFRISCSKYEHFKIEPVYLDIKNITGKLIYWNDWEYIFQQIDNDYFLWCYLGGVADIHREIKLSDEQVRKYKEIGLAEIDFLITDIKKMNGSVEYENAIKENRRIL